MGYCADDVRATLELTTKVFPLFRERCPHPVTLSGMLEMSVPLLPISRDRWDHYVRQADDLSEETERDTEKVCFMHVEGDSRCNDGRVQGTRALSQGGVPVDGERDVQRRPLDVGPGVYITLIVIIQQCFLEPDVRI